MSNALQLQRRLRLALQNDDYDEAILCLQEAAALARAEGDHDTEGRYLGNLALMCHRAGRSQEALDYFRQALVLVRAEGDRITEDGLLGNMGSVLRELGQLDEALKHLNQALLIAQEIGDIRGRGIWLSNLGLAHDDLGQPQQALLYHQQAVEVARDLHDQRGQASRLSKLAATCTSLRDYEQAQRSFTESIDLYRQIDDQAGLLETLISAGQFQRVWGQALENAAEAQIHFQKTYDYHMEALTLARRHGEIRLQAELLLSLGTEVGNRGKYAQAITYFTESAHLFAELGLVQRLPEIHKNIDTAMSLQKEH
ncbi:MAG: tetratricopeptide repeat protein [Anaerolineae bacterium]|nr:tetratricopeptide repeat protein [Anaerolineae bacterium]